jgi:hypothetical protein
MSHAWEAAAKERMDRALVVNFIFVCLVYLRKIMGEAQ